MFFCSALQAVVVVVAAVSCASFVIWPFLAATRCCCCSCARNCVLRRWSVQQTKELDILLSHFLLLPFFFNYFVVVVLLCRWGCCACVQCQKREIFICPSLGHTWQQQQQQQTNNSSSNNKNNAALAQLLRSSLCCSIRVRSNFLPLLFLHVHTFLLLLLPFCLWEEGVRKKSTQLCSNNVAVRVVATVALLLLLLLPLCCCCCQVRRDKWKCLCVHCSHCSDKYLHNSSDTAPPAFSLSLSLSMLLSICLAAAPLPACLAALALCTFLASHCAFCPRFTWFAHSLLVSLLSLSSPCLSLPLLLIPCLLFAPINQRRLALYQVYSPHSSNLLLL